MRFSLATLLMAAASSMRPGQNQSLYVEEVGKIVIVQNHTASRTAVGAADANDTAVDADGNGTVTGSGIGDDLQSAWERELQQAIDVGTQMQSWSLGTTVGATFVCALWILYPLILTLFYLPRDVMNDVGITDIRPTGDYCCSESMGDMPSHKDAELLWRRRILKAECLLNAIQPFIVAAVWGLVAWEFQYEFATTPPVWAQCMIIVPSLLRAIRVETTLADTSVLKFLYRDFTTPQFPPAPFLRTKGEVIDASTDGLSIVIVYMLEHYNELFSERLAVFCASDYIGVLLAPLSGLLGLSGLLIFVQVVASVVQFSAVRLTITDDGWLAADTAGFGGLAEIILDDGPQPDDLEYKHMGRSLYEAVPQLFIQSVAIICAGEGLAGQALLTVSLGFGILLLVWRSTVLVKIGCSGRGAMPSIGGLVMLSMVAVMVYRLYASEGCESKMFSISEWSCITARVPAAE